MRNWRLRQRAAHAAFDRCGTIRPRALPTGGDGGRRVAQVLQVRLGRSRVYDVRAPSVQVTKIGAQAKSMSLDPGPVVSMTVADSEPGEQFALFE